MSATVFLFSIVGGTLAAALWIAWRRYWHGLRERAWLPEELKDARLEVAERLFRTARPFGLFAKVDRAYGRADGILVLTELKRRFHIRAYQSDVVELSAQKLAIERGAKRRVAVDGFVVVEHPATRQRTPISVPLLGEEELIALRQRYERLLLGATLPHKANDVRLCRSCAYVDRCKPQLLGNQAAAPIRGGGAALQAIGNPLAPDQLTAAGMRSVQPARRRETRRSPGKSKTRARRSPGSDRNRRA